MNQVYSQCYYDAIKGDFKNFLFVVHQYLGLQAPTPLQYEMCLAIQHGSDRLMIQAFRGCGKSHILACFAVWSLLNDPRELILVVSATSQRAKAFSDFCQRLIIDMPVLQHLKPANSKTSWTKEMFSVNGADISQTASLTSIGLTGQITGKRATLIFADDIETSQNALNQETRESLLNATNEFQSVIIPDRPSRIIYLGTPQSKNSIYNNIIDKGYNRNVWTAEIPDAKTIDYYGDDLAPSLKEMYYNGEYGEPTEPLRFPTDVLAKAKQTYGIAGYQLQFMLNTTETDKERYPLNQNMFIVTDSITHSYTYEIIDESGVSGNMIPYATKILAIDPAGSGADKTGYIVLAQWSGYIAILEVGTMDNGYEDSTMHEFNEIVKAYKIHKIIVEQNFGGGTYTALLKKMVKVSEIEEIRNTRQKELRIIDTLEPPLLQRKLIIHSNVYKEQQENKHSPHNLFYQMNNITRDKGSLEHDDCLDALALGVGYLAETLTTDPQKMRETRENQRKQRELDAFIAMAQPIHGGGVTENRSKFYLD